jgi:hypothetical protein
MKKVKLNCTRKDSLEKTAMRSSGKFEIPEECTLETPIVGWPHNN